MSCFFYWIGYSFNIMSHYYALMVINLSQIYNNLLRMKVIVALLVLFAIVFAQSPELEKCIQEKCPTEYKKCLSTSGCKAKLEKCAKQCGEKIAQTCWTLCIGLPGAAANVCTCAVNKGCITNSSKMDIIGLNLMQAIETYMEQ